MPRAKQFDEQEVLEKAMHLFWHKGYHSTSIQDLVDELGINRASMYHAFGGKEQLFTLAFSTYTERVLRVKKDILQGEESVVQGFQKLFRVVIGLLIRDRRRRGCLIVNTAAELLPGEHSALTLLEEARRQEHLLFQKALQKGIDRGELAKDTDPRDLASFLQSVYSGITLLSKLESEADELHNISDRALRALA